MNYYPFHIGDYTAHTSHLSPDEDIVYRRMLDVYYLQEKALPADLAKVARLIRMPKSSKAIANVLNEFFVLSEDGWHNQRADAELTSMLTKQEQQSAKDAHEAERMRRYRERRAEMFSALRSHGVVPAWDIPMKELQRLFDTTCNAPATPPATDLQREQIPNCNASATAIPIPTPIPTPIGVQGGKPPNPPLELPSWLPKTEWGEFVAMRKAKGKRAPFTDAAARGVIDAVGRLRDVGNDPAAVLRQSVVNGWSGVFELKGPATAGIGRRQQTVDWTEQAL